MLTREFKENALRKLKEMDAEEFIEVFEKIGSQKAPEKDNLKEKLSKLVENLLTQCHKEG